MCADDQGAARTMWLTIARGDAGHRHHHHHHHGQHGRDDHDERSAMRKFFEIEQQHEAVTRRWHNIWCRWALIATGVGTLFLILMVVFIALFANANSSCKLSDLSVVPLTKSDDMMQYPILAIRPQSGAPYALSTSPLYATKKTACEEHYLKGLKRPSVAISSPMYGNKDIMGLKSTNGG